MASAIYTIAGYQHDVTVKQVETPNKNEVIFVPTVVDLQSSATKLLKMLEWRRGMTDFFSGFVSGAVLLR